MANLEKRKDDHPHDHTYNGNIQYSAFVSYRNLKLDTTIAEKLHRALENYRTPKSLVKAGKPKRIRKVFLDKLELSAGDLSKKLSDVLTQTPYLILICSDETPKSPWIHEEIEFFLGNHDVDRVFPVLIKGELESSIPQGILDKIKKKKVDAQGRQHEVVGSYVIDLRAPNLRQTLRKMKNEKLRILAPLLDCKYDELKQRELARRRKKRKTVVMALCTMFLLAMSFWLWTRTDSYQVSRVLSTAPVEEVSSLINPDKRRTILEWSKALILAEKTNTAIDAVKKLPGPSSRAESLIDLADWLSEKKMTTQADKVIKSAIQIINEYGTSRVYHLLVLYYVERHRPELAKQYHKIMINEYFSKPPPLSLSDYDIEDNIKRYALAMAKKGMFAEAVEAASKIKRTSPYGHCETMEEIAKILRESGKIKKSNHLMTETQKWANNLEIPNIRRNCLRGIAITAALASNWKLSLEAASNFGSKSKSSWDTIELLCKISQLLYSKGSQALGDKFIQEAKAIAEKEDNIWRWETNSNVAITLSMGSFWKDVILNSEKMTKKYMIETLAEIAIVLEQRKMINEANTIWNKAIITARNLDIPDKYRYLEEFALLLAEAGRIESARLFADEFLKGNIELSKQEADEYRSALMERYSMKCLQEKDYKKAKETAVRIPDKGIREDVLKIIIKKLIADKEMDEALNVGLMIPGTKDEYRDIVNGREVIRQAYVLEKLSMKMADEGDFDKAIYAAEKLPEPDRSKTQYQLVKKLQASKKYEYAKQLALKIEAPVQRIQSISLIASQIYESGQKKEAIELMENARLYVKAKAENFPTISESMKIISIQYAAWKEFRIARLFCQPNFCLPESRLQVYTAILSGFTKK